ncbi:MAG TPA: hypothetical protein VEA61_10765 [Allosphingosinicella sp.]|nr:hypothetical protein [Allosphingosinicella sp.]
MAILPAVLALALASPAQPADAAFLAFRPAEGETFARHVFFHRPGVGMEEARADLAECRSYASSAMLWPREPDSLPPDPKQLPPDVSGGPLGPVVGGLAFALVEGGERAKIAAANMRKCMGFKGYGRYGLSDALWKQLNAGTPEEVLLRQARLASGEAPSGRRLDP